MRNGPPSAVVPTAAHDARNERRFNGCREPRARSAAPPLAAAGSDGPFQDHRTPVGNHAVGRERPEHAADVAFDGLGERHRAECVQLRGQAQKGAVVSALLRVQQLCLKIGERRAHTDQRRARAHHQGVTEEPVFAGNQQFLGVLLHHRRDPLKGHHRIERRDFDPDDPGQREDVMQRAVIVIRAARGGVEIEGNDGQLLRQLVVKDDGVVVWREGEERIRAAALRVTCHGRAVGSGDNGLFGKRRAPLLQHHAPLILRQMLSPPGMRPHRYARDGLASHPGRVRPLGGNVDH